MLLKSYSEVDCVVSDDPRIGMDADRMPVKVWSLSFKPDQEVGFLFPYLNGALDDALWYERPDHVRFLFEGRRCLLYPDRAAAHFFETRESAVAFIRPLMDFLNSLDARKSEIKPNFNQIRHVKIPEVLKLLPQTNCRECGFPTCMAFAAAVARGKILADQCPGLASPMSESAVYPVFDRQGNLIHSLSLKIDTAGLKRRIKDQDLRIRSLEARLETKARPNPSEPEPVTESAPDSVPETKSESMPDPGSESVAGPAAALTDREIEVLTRIAQGYTNNEIGGLLFISPHTVKSHMINIFNKFGVSDRTQAAVLGVRTGLI
ncbi:LuxR C-terminal-related transcriptional regulator [Desulfospira joergensenii]|uniref:LuxR C-terminal-related transcriptional regulator n=1 Tax=Desulfospira joergensenii TaxID=53329 RepID=UPI0003B4FBBF|nr:LuxR C-terminal-related transcriptional regulator [Desulfospira joergensenii]